MCANTRHATNKLPFGAVANRGADGAYPRDVISRYLTCPCVTSVFSKPMHLRAGAAADFRRKRNGNAWRASRRLRESYWTPGGFIPQRRRVWASSNVSGSVGNGPPALTPAIRDTSLFPERWANTMASLCPPRWCCAEDPASRPRVTYALPTETSSNPKLDGNSPACVWQFRRD